MNICEQCGKETDRPRFCSDKCQCAAYRVAHKDELNKAERARQKAKRESRRPGIAKCANPGCQNDASTRKQGSTCSRRCEMLVYRMKHPKVKKEKETVTRICALDGCNKLAQTNKERSCCSSAHKSKYYRAIAAKAAGREPGKVGRKSSVLIVSCQCGCGVSFEVKKRARSCYQRKYVDRFHAGAHQSEVAKEYRVPTESGELPVRAKPLKTRLCICGCGKRMSVSDYPNRKFAPDCEDKDAYLKAHQPVRTVRTILPPTKSKVTATRVERERTYSQMKPLPRNKSALDLRMDAIAEASKKNGYNPKIPDRFVDEVLRAGN